jgi:type I restriction enzyme S subunit
MNLTFDEAFTVGKTERKAVKQKDYLSEGKFPVIDQGENFISGYSDDEAQVLDFTKPVIIFGDHTRRLKYVNFPFIPGADGTKILVQSDSMDSKFAFYQLQSKDLRDKGYARHFSELRKEEFWVPSIDEQHTIVKLLEDHLSRLDAALADVTQGHKKIGQFRRSFLQETFIEREGTQYCTLGDFVEIKTGKIDANRAVVDGKYPFFTCAREISRIDEAPFDGKVVLVAGNGDLNVKYYEGKFNAYQRTYILKSKNEEILFPKYLFWFLEHYIFELRTLAIGTTIKYIKLGNLVDPRISLPSLEIQKQIVLEIERTLSFVNKWEETFNKLTKESQSLRRALLKSAFSGNLTNEVLHV